MKQFLAVFAVATMLLSGSAARAQNKPADKGTEKAQAAKPANAPVSGSAAGNAPEAKASATGSSGTAAPASGGKTIGIRVPSGGEYSAYIQEASGTAPKK